MDITYNNKLKLYILTIKFSYNILRDNTFMFDGNSKIKKIVDIT